MIFYDYTCPECELVVRLEQPSDDILKIKACVCPCDPVETTEEAPS